MRASPYTQVLVHCTHTCAKTHTIGRIPYIRDCAHTHIYTHAPNSSGDEEDAMQMHSHLRMASFRQGYHALDEPALARDVTLDSVEMITGHVLICGSLNALHHFVATLRPRSDLYTSSLALSLALSLSCAHALCLSVSPFLYRKAQNHTQLKRRMTCKSTCTDICREIRCFPSSSCTQSSLMKWSGPSSHTFPTFISFRARP